MSWPEDHWGDPGFYPDEGGALHWPLDWRGLYPRERWLWFEQLWSEVCLLRDRYRLAVRSGWWENELQLEALAALSAWVSRYDSGEWDDPPGKLALLYDLERVSALLRDGVDPFSPDRDRSAFVRHLIALGCQPPPEGDILAPGDANPTPEDANPTPGRNGYRHEIPPRMNGHDPPAAA